MTIKKLVARTFALTLCLSSSGAIGADDSATVTMRPLMAASYVSGSKHVLSFFVREKGACNLTIMISELKSDEAEATGPRIVIAIEPLKSSRLDIADGKSLEFVCGQMAATMDVLSLERVSYFQR